MSGIFQDLYKGRKVLVTGHTGFKGSWFSIWLRELGADVIGYSLGPPSTPNNFEACALEKRLKHIHGDIRDLERLMAIFERYRPEIVFHLAAQSLVRLSYEDPKCTFDTNVGGTVNVLEAARLASCVRVFITVTSDKCYENREWVWGYREQDRIGGRDPYSASKGCAELVSLAYQNSFFSEQRKIGIASVRSGNVIGGGDWGTARIIPDSVRALSRAQSIEIRHPQSIRPWQYILEPISGYLWLGAFLLNEPDKYAGAWNFGPSQEAARTVQELVEAFIKLWGNGSWKEISMNGNNLFPEAGLLHLCCDKAHTYLKWRACLKFEEALRMTVQWYKEYYRSGLSADMYAKCVAQIQEYVLSAKRQGLVWSK